MSNFETDFNRQDLYKNPAEQYNFEKLLGPENPHRPENREFTEYDSQLGDERARKILDELSKKLGFEIGDLKTKLLTEKNIPQQQRALIEAEIERKEEEREVYYEASEGLRLRQEIRYFEKASVERNAKRKERLE